MISKLISGGQTGVDRAALDVAIALTIHHGGWCPKGRLAEDGVIAAHYLLQETLSENPLVRTQQNVLDADATLIFFLSIEDAYQDGTGATIDCCKKYQKDYFLHMAEEKTTDQRCLDWLLSNQQITVLNIAGPRESNWKEAYRYTKVHLMKMMMAYLKQ